VASALIALRAPAVQAQLAEFLKSESNSALVVGLINQNKAFLIAHDRDIRPNVPEQFRYLLPHN
jgi:hypothetical protein